jgi:uncharacterized protein with gpF-like domain
MHLERRLELLYELIVTQLAARTVPKIEKTFEKEFVPITDALEDEVEKAIKGALSGEDPTTTGRLVQFQGVTLRAAVRDPLVSTLDDLAQWSLRTAEQGIRRLGRQGIIQRPDNMIVQLRSETADVETAIQKAAARNANLIKTTRQDYLGEVATITRGAVEGGVAPKALAAQLQHLTGVTKSRAKFWARDQVGYWGI